MVNKQIPSAAIRLPQNLEYLHQYCLPIWLSVSSGRTGLVLINCYLSTGSAARATREEILRDIFQFASMYDHCPVLMGGDLQMDTSESSAIAEALCHFSVVAARDVQIFRGPLAPGHCPINLELDVEVFCTECMMLKPVESWNLPTRPRNQQAWQKRNEK